MSTRIFISVGSCFRPEQEAFVAALEDLLTEHKLLPRTVGRNVFSTRPLRAVTQEMRRCSGAVIIALERIRIERGTEKGHAPLSHVALTTPWNHIEAAMAYTLGLPMLVLKEKQVRSEGMLEECDERLQEFEPNPSFLRQRAFKGRFDAWRRKVRGASERRLLQPALSVRA